jgi:uncharacterized protein
MVLEVLARVAVDLWTTVTSVWPFLLASVLAAAALEVYVGTERLAGWLRARTWVAVVGAVSLASATPFCSCGTTAVTLGMLATSAPWATIVAFMVASPLTSPSELLLSAGLLGWPFALLFFGGTIVLGLGAGVVAAVLDRRGWLEGQARFASAGSRSDDAPTTCTTATGAPSTCATSAAPGGRGSTPREALSVGPGAAAVTEVGTWAQRLRLRRFARELGTVGRRLAALFLGFTALGYLVIELVPTAWLQAGLGGDRFSSIVVAAVLGVPAYVNTEGSLPLLASLRAGGMGPGAAMAFLVTGAGTSVGAIGGLLVIARGRVVGLVVAALFVGALVLGTVTQVVLG